MEDHDDDDDDDDHINPTRAGARQAYLAGWQGGVHRMQCIYRRDGASRPAFLAWALGGHGRWSRTKVENYSREL